MIRTFDGEYHQGIKQVIKSFIEDVHTPNRPVSTRFYMEGKPWHHNFRINSDGTVSVTIFEKFRILPWSSSGHGRNTRHCLRANHHLLSRCKFSEYLGQGDGLMSENQYLTTVLPDPTRRVQYGKGFHTNHHYHTITREYLGSERIRGNVIAQVVLANPPECVIDSCACWDCLS